MTAFPQAGAHLGGWAEALGKKVPVWKQVLELVLGLPSPSSWSSGNPRADTNHERISSTRRPDGPHL